MNLFFCLQAHGDTAAQEYEDQVLKESVAWREWYGKRIIATWGPFDANSSPSAVSRCAGQLTDFLSLLPPTKSADRILLCSYISKQVYPDSPALQEGLVSEMMLQIQELRKKREVSIRASLFVTLFGLLTVVVLLFFRPLKN